ncbi:histidinol-phosphatase [Thermomicrobium sp. 4228-Ro]|uniref:histidinol-phosphatase n=1 Tax=Thermomicrobium sp. 4228-Ro TaxID=2993937 RepID=UPI002248F8BF|nr:histidinol-phosphatase [Thermomicrobium sp. 4228-Ro]MCX2728380.1 histidinol-phosphatase [Thermomicrobium sp. 4228-Ro]
MLGSYHNHPGYCDGSGSVEDYIVAARQAGLAAVGFSSHAPVPFPCDWTMTVERFQQYLTDVRAAQERWRGRFPIWLGVELDYLDPLLVPGGMAFQREVVLGTGLDYAVVSLHFVGRDGKGHPWAVDESAESFARQVEEVYGGDVRRLVEDYYRLLRQLVHWASTLGLPAVIGHLDKVKQWNLGGRYFSESAAWYRQAVERVLAAIRETGLPIELNTAGLRRAIAAPYPSEWVLHRCRELAIPVTIGADAHRPEDVTAGFAEAQEILAAVGYREVSLLSEAGWQPVPLPTHT